jgi:hypothetical protein
MGTSAQRRSSDSPSDSHSTPSRPLNHGIQSPTLDSRAICLGPAPPPAVRYGGCRPAKFSRVQILQNIPSIAASTLASFEPPSLSKPLPPSPPPSVPPGHLHHLFGARTTGELDFPRGPLVSARSSLRPAPLGNNAFCHFCCSQGNAHSCLAAFTRNFPFDLRT